MNRPNKSTNVHIKNVLVSTKRYCVPAVHVQSNAPAKCEQMNYTHMYLYSMNKVQAMNIGHVCRMQLSFIEIRYHAQMYDLVTTFLVFRISRVLTCYEYV